MGIATGSRTRLEGAETLACMRIAHEAHIPILAVTTALWGGRPLEGDLWAALEEVKNGNDARAAYWTCHESYFSDPRTAVEFRHEAVGRCIAVVKTFGEARWAHSFATTPDQKSRALGKMMVLGAEFVAQAKTAAELLKFHEGYLWDLGRDELSELAHAVLTRALELASDAQEARSVYSKAPEGSGLRFAAIRKLAPFYGIEP